MIAHKVVNALAIVSGIVCDGAKASCAAKIATAVEAGIFGYNMYIRGQEFYGGDGIVAKGIETSLKNVGRLGKEGMKETNEEIIKIMNRGVKLYEKTYGEFTVSIVAWSCDRHSGGAVCR